MSQFKRAVYDVVEGISNCPKITLIFGFAAAAGQADLGLIVGKIVAVAGEVGLGPVVGKIAAAAGEVDLGPIVEKIAAVADEVGLRPIVGKIGAAGFIVTLGSNIIADCFKKNVLGMTTVQAQTTLDNMKSAASIPASKDLKNE